MIRRMIKEDLDTVMSLERQLFANPWSKESFLFEMSDPSCFMYVIEEEEIIGYGGFHSLSGDGEISNVAIAPKYQGQKYGEKLFSFLLDECARIKCEKVFLEVRVDNVPALNLYQKHGFKVNRVRKKYYQNTDGYEMIKEFKYD